MKSIWLVAVALVILRAGNFAAADVSLKNELTATGVGYSSGGTSGQYYGELRYRPSLSAVSESFSLYAQGDLRSDTAGYAAENKASRASRQKATFGEAYLTWLKNAVRFNFGKQIVDWSITDVVSPSDNVSPRDWTEVVDWERIGVPAARLWYENDGDNSVKVEIAVTKFTPGVMPAGRFWTTTAPLGDYEQRGGDLPNYATRLSTKMAGWEIGSTLYRGYGYSPDLEWNAISGVLTPIYRLETVHSVYAVGNIGRSLLKIDAGRFSADAGKDFYQYAIAVERAMGDLYLVAEYVGDSEADPSSSDLRRALARHLLAKARFTINDDWTSEFSGAYDLRRGSSFVKLALNWTGDSLATEVGMKVFSGSADTFFGNLEKNDAIYLKITWRN